MSFAPVQSIIRKVIKRGTLEVILANGERTVYGDGAAPRAVARVRDRMTPLLIATNPVLRIGEAYMDGRLTFEEGTDLVDFLGLVCLNMAWSIDNPNYAFAQTQQRFGAVLGQINKLKQSKKNVAHHYDISNKLYEMFLDTDMQYSCAYFTDPEMSLEDAQIAKKKHIRGKLLLDKPDLSVLDIGCGWGGMARTLASDGGARVKGVTLSEEQIKLARERTAAAGLTERVSFDLIDYREVQGQFDRIVSVGMFEHVGRPNYKTYFKTCHSLLDNDGVMLLHTIGRVDGPGDTDPWFTKYIFPGGYAPALSELIPHIERAGFFITDVEIWRNHYAHTLRHWYYRCVAHRAEIVAMLGERFYRMWEFFLVAARFSFEHLSNVVFQIQLAKRRERVPQTRDYMYGR